MGLRLTVAVAQKRGLVLSRKFQDHSKFSQKTAYHKHSNLRNGVASAYGSLLYPRPFSFRKIRLPRSDENLLLVVTLAEETKMNAFERYERTNALAFNHEDEAYQMYLEQNRDREEAEGALANVLPSVALGNGTG